MKTILKLFLNIILFIILIPIGLSIIAILSPVLMALVPLALICVMLWMFWLIAFGVTVFDEIDNKKEDEITE